VKPTTTWLFDLDNTLHDASHAAFAPTSHAMSEYVAEHLGLPLHEASALREHYWQRYGATLLGIVRHHAHIRPAHFLDHTHRLPGLEQRLRTSSHDRAALARLPGRKVVLTNAPRAYALRVLAELRLLDAFDAVLSIEDMRMFGQWRPKPDARMFRRIAVRLRTPAARCVLVEDTLEHQRAARSVGMRTVWMQRYLGGRFRGSSMVPRHTGLHTHKVGVHPCRRPSYVCARIVSLQSLRALRR
jgi:putative hydrolase of the HAD superfamily